MAVKPSRHRVLEDGSTVPATAKPPVAHERDLARRVMVPRERLDKRSRRALGAWLVARLGRPDRVAGLWWADDRPEGLLVTMCDDAVFMEFALTWCY